MTELRLGRAAAAVLALVLAALAGLTGCRLAPVEIYEAPLADGAALRPAATGTADAYVSLHAWPSPSPRAVVLLVPGLGSNALVWDEPPGAGLATALQREGYTTYAIDPRGVGASSAFVGPGGAADLATIAVAHAADLIAALTLLGRRHPGLPLFAIGHDVAGTSLLYAARDPAVHLRGLVLFGTPLAPGGRSRAFATILAHLDALGATPTWPSLRTATPIASAATDGDLGRMLLTTGMTPERWTSFADRAAAPLAREWLTALAAEGDAPVPTPGALVADLTAHPIPLLVVMGFADGLTPPWQCDPAALGLRRADITRIYLGRENGDDADYNHLDLVLGETLPSDLWPRLVDWIEAQRR